MGGGGGGGAKNGFRHQKMVAKLFVKSTLKRLNTLKMGVVPACMVLMMKWGPRKITSWPGVSIM